MVDTCQSWSPFSTVARMGFDAAGTDRLSSQMMGRLAHGRYTGYVSRFIEKDDGLCVVPLEGEAMTRLRGF